MPITPTKLRANLGCILDEEITTGTPVEVVRKGVRLTITPARRVSKLANLKKRSGFVGDFDDIVHIDWLKDAYVQV